MSLKVAASGKLKIALTVLMLWLVCSVTAFYNLFWSHYGTFDPQGDWHQSPSPQLSPDQISRLFQSKAEWQGILITDPDCQCSSFAKEHLQRLQTRHPLIEISTLELNDLTQLQATFNLKVVASPLFILFKDQQLLYAGPLATDRLCSDNASILDGIITGATVLPGLWLNGESTACRCLAP